MLQISPNWNGVDGVSVQEVVVELLCTCMLAYREIPI